MKPALIIMAAGMGSRYGGLKQIDTVDDAGDKIVDFSVYDAMKAGFGKVVFVIKKENEADFREALGDRISNHIEVDYAFQDLSDIPEGFTVPGGRVKPWGTAQAVLSAAEKVRTPFAVINADDFYGREAFTKIHDFLVNGNGENEYAMVSFILRNTLTENGYVSRGICSVDEEGFLKSVTERTHIEADGEKARYTLDGGESWIPLSGDEAVSMNIWGFSPSFMEELKNAFRDFLSDLPKAEDPLKAECYLPGVVDKMLKEGRARVRVLSSSDRWFGVTYKEDKDNVKRSITDLKNKGIYPERLW
ncbi:MAG: nucleotidyltransferase [Lachnospiraceae bacterium]|nr:nucleotidyltransferase [Lachnospiraceae bacterium]